jgi:DNA polymerase I-like protein with 3'-5' exonuclease and polymerase domains
MYLFKYSRHEVVDLILHHRTLSKSKNTFLDGLLEFAVKDPNSQRCHINAEWNQLSVETGRLSCAKPALQCLPKEPIPIDAEQHLVCHSLPFPSVLVVDHVAAYNV